MSGHIWWPAWMLDAAGTPGDLYADPELLRGQELLLSTCARALATARFAPSTLPTRSMMPSARVAVHMRAHGRDSWPRRCGVARRMYP